MNNCAGFWVIYFRNSWNVGVQHPWSRRVTQILKEWLPRALWSTHQLVGVVFFLRPPGRMNHDMYSDIFWHSIWNLAWHVFGHTIWHLFWHSIWHSTWHSIWHSIRHIFWYFCRHSIWHSYLSYSGILSYILSDIFSHSVWHILTFYLTFKWHSTGILPGILCGLVPDILLGIFSYFLSGIRYGILSGSPIWHKPWHSF